jgi:hypothetical protein
MQNIGFELRRIPVPRTSLNKSKKIQVMLKESRPSMIRNLAEALEVPFHKETLKVAEGLKLWDVLRKELLTFRRKQNTVTSHISYEHWRESDHDDLVLAAALACWKATYKRKGTTKLRLIR